MNFGPASGFSIWNTATRTLTSLGSGTISLVGNAVGATLANGASFDARPTATKGRFLFIFGHGAVNVTWSLGTWDGTTFTAFNTGASGAAISFEGPCNNVFGYQLKNTGTTSGNYDIMSIDLIQ